MKDGMNSQKGYAAHGINYIIGFIFYYIVVLFSLQFLFVFSLAGEMTKEISVMLSGCSMLLSTVILLNKCIKCRCCLEMLCINKVGKKVVILPAMVVAILTFIFGFFIFGFSSSPAEGGAGNVFYFLFFYFISVTVFSPISEEFLFRGVVFSALLNGNLGRVCAVLLCSILFCLVHLFVFNQNVITLFLLSVFVCVLRLKSGSVLPAVAAHSSYNAVVFFSVLI